MLTRDSLVTDLMFTATAAIDQQVLIDALGGEAAVTRKKLLDPDMLGPRAEMELSPSQPFRRRGERRLLIIDDSVAPMRKDPDQDLIIPLDLRPHKEALVLACQQLPVRLGRLFSLGEAGDAVIVARSARDLRGICLLPWVLDPQIDSDGKRRAGTLNKQEYEAKFLSYEKRLDELDEGEILAGLSGVSFERRGELLVVDVLEPDGTWDLRKSMLMEQQLAALDRFSLIAGAPSSRKPTAPAAKSVPTPAAAPPVPLPEPAGPPLRTADVSGAVVLVFPPERFDLDVAAALGKRDWSAVLRRGDNVPGAIHDRIHREGAGWVAPLEFLSEVFVDGKPLNKAFFNDNARDVGTGIRALDVHFPRFGPVVLMEISGRGRFVTSLSSSLPDVANLIT
jgi:hypothetical protein